MQKQETGPLCGVDLLVWCRDNAKVKSKMAKSTWCVAPGVYLGTKQSAAKLEALTFLGISRIVNVGGGPCLFAEVDYWEIHLSDKRDADLLTELDDATQFIHESVLAGTGVLCHCQGGFSRSPAVLMAYFMRFRGLSFDQALEVLQLQRSCANPNEGFVKQLHAYARKLLSGSVGVRAERKH